MSNDLERTVNLAAYERMKTHLEEKFPKGHFVGISLGRIVADAPKLDDLIARVKDLGFDPRNVLAVQAGDETPHYTIIL
jgi:hypothetical protein